MLAPEHPLVDGRTASAPAVLAFRGQRQDRTPVWFRPQPHAVLRDAGHELPLQAACLDPELAAEMTTRPVGQFDTDAAALFTDPALAVLLAGVDGTLGPEGGLQVDAPIRTASEVLQLRPVEPDAFAPVADAVRAAVRELGEVPLVAVATGPFALASALIEGGPSADHFRARALMYADPHTWAALLNWCADVSGAFLRAQVEAGASAAQLTDAGVGSLSRREYQRRVGPHTHRALAALRGLDVPRIIDAPDADAVLELLPGFGADVVGVGRRVPLDEAHSRIRDSFPTPVALQGNLDPALLHAPLTTLRAHLDDVLDRGRDAPTHVLSFGDTLPVDAPAEKLTLLVKLAKAAVSRSFS